MPQPSDAPKPGFIRVKYELVYTSDVPLSAYPDMSVEEAVKFELESDVETIIETITGSDGTEDDRLTVRCNAEYITE